jgi:hypothetical protein
MFKIFWIQALLMKVKLETAIYNAAKLHLNMTFLMRFINIFLNKPHQT